MIFILLSLIPLATADLSALDAADICRVNYTTNFLCDPESILSDTDMESLTKSLAKFNSENNIRNCGHCLFLAVAGSFGIGDVRRWGDATLNVHKPVYRKDRICYSSTVITFSEFAEYAYVTSGYGSPLHGVYEEKIQQHSPTKSDKINLSGLKQAMDELATSAAHASCLSGIYGKGSLGNPAEKFPDPLEHKLHCRLGEDDQALFCDPEGVFFISLLWMSFFASFCRRLCDDDCKILWILGSFVFFFSFSVLERQKRCSRK